MTYRPVSPSAPVKALACAIQQAVELRGSHQVMVSPPGTIILVDKGIVTLPDDPYPRVTYGGYALGVRNPGVLRLCGSREWRPIDTSEATEILLDGEPVWSAGEGYDVGFETLTKMNPWTGGQNEVGNVSTETDDMLAELRAVADLALRTALGERVDYSGIPERWMGLFEDIIEDVRDHVMRVGR